VSIVSHPGLVLAKRIRSLPIRDQLKT